MGEKKRSEELTREIEQVKKEFKKTHGKKLKLDAEYLEVAGKLKRAEEEFKMEKLKRKSMEEAERTLQLLEIELEEVEGTLLKEREMQAATQERRLKVVRDLSRLEMALEDLEVEEKRLSGIVAQEEAEVQKLLETVARLRLNHATLITKRDALGGIQPELIQKYKGTSRKELGKLMQKVLAKIKKCRGVNQKADY